MAGNLAGRTWHFLAQTRVAVVLMAVLLLVVVIGSFFPQRSPAMIANAERLAQWQEAVQARYGALTERLAIAGVFTISRSPFFLAALALLALVTLVCTLHRWRGVWRRVVHRPVVCADVVFDAAPQRATLTLPSPTALPDLLAAILRQRGFRVQTAARGDALFLRGDRHGWAALGTLVDHLALLLLLLATLLSSTLGWRQELSITPGEAAQLSRGDGIVISNQGFEIVRYLDGSAADYQARVRIARNGQAPVLTTIAVNRPAKVAGITLLLTGYETTPSGHRLILLAVRDPGYGLVIAAGFLLLLGMTVTLYLPHCRVHARLDPDGTLRLAGRAERQAGDFEREFAALVEELRRAVPPVDEGQATAPGGQPC